jgi:hypothetical protein
MKKTFILIIILVSQLSFSQVNLKTLTLDHKVNSAPVYRKSPFHISAIPDTLYVYAALVQFKQDNTSNTTGDGRFDVSNNYPDSVDAPPHDNQYFINHLEFLKNYYWKASKGKLFIKYEIIGDVRNLSQEMTYYSPGRNENLSKLGNMFFETWKSVDSVYNFAGINPDKSAFIIFHAGAGRDVDLVSSGIFEGEADLPSVYLSLSTLKSLYGDTTKGYYTNEGIIIGNSAVLPEQEYRIISSSFGDQFLELGMNGIMVASIGSHLGLPDLFDTQSGRTAIGRFGLMDGQSLFSYMGVFPPEPSAWEKQYLGWVNPLLIINNGTFNSRAASLDDGNTSVYKVLLSGSEYFLIENRNRDALKNGETVYFISNGVRDSIKFTKDIDGFNNAEVWKLKGSITDVDELDWSLPGLVNDTANYQGGLLIWHIDENVIYSNLPSNTINTNINHRGVDLEEAKGAQDIGVQISTPFGTIVGDGFFVDFWYNGNHYVPSNVYKNEFTQSTIPNTKSYSNIDSRVCLKNFSAIDSSMTFTYEVCSSISNINGFPRFIGFSPDFKSQPVGFDFNSNGYDEIFINYFNSIYGFRDNGNPIRVDQSNGRLIDSLNQLMVGYLEAMNENPQYLVASSGQDIKLISFTIDPSTSYPTVQSISTGADISTPSLYFQNNTLYFGTMNGKICKLIGSNFSFDSVSNQQITQLAFNSANYSYITLSNKYIVIGKLFSSGNNMDTVIVTNDNKLLVNGKIISSNLGINSINSSPVIADLNKDGNQEIIFSADNKLFAVNPYGTHIDHFPFQVTGINSFNGGCSVADLDGDGVFEVIFGTGDGRIYAYNSNGSVLQGFPLLTGKDVRSTPAIINSEGKFGLVVSSTDGYLYAWKTPWDYDASRIQWRNYLNNKYHSNSNFQRFASTYSGSCLPKDRAYNWPNPVYSGKTYIRYFLNGQATSVKIRIMDLAGELVTMLDGTTNSGVDNEVIWDVSNVQSGIYIGVIKPEGGDCSETVSFKIAVVK